MRAIKSWPIASMMVLSLILLPATWAGADADLKRFESHKAKTQSQFKALPQAVINLREGRRFPFFGRDNPAGVVRGLTILVCSIQSPSCAKTYQQARQSANALQGLRIIYLEMPSAQPGGVDMAKLVLAAAREAKLSEFLDAVTNDPTSTGHPDAAAAQAGLDWRKLQADAGSDVVNEEHEAIRRFLGEVHISDVPFFGGMLRTIQKDGQPDDSTFVVTQPFASKDFKQNVDAMMHCRTAHFADVAIGRYHCDG